MKKILSGVFIIISLFVCLVFSACGENKYKNLSMYFCNTNGERLDSVEFVIDSSESNTNNSMRIAVTFEGINSEDIGDVLIYSLNNTVDVKNYVFQNDMCYVDITAKTPSNGRLYVKHMASNKMESIPLNIKLKSDNLKLKSANISTYIISLSTIGQKLIDANLLFNLFYNGSVANCTDKIYFKSTNMDNPLFVTEVVEGEPYIIGFDITEETKSDPIELYPVTYLKDYTPTEYPAVKVNFVFVNTLEEDKLSLEADELHNENLKNGEQIILISNTSYDLAHNKDDSTLNNIRVKLVYDGDGETLKDYFNFGLNNAGYEYFYPENVIAPTDDDYFTIHADVNNFNPILITLGLKPKNCVGDINIVSKSFEVKSEYKPSEITVSMQDNVLTEENGIINVANPLYDYYENDQNFSNLGAKFVFTPSTNSVSALRKLRIGIEPKYINAYIADLLTGTNHIYTSSNFESEYANLINENFNGQYVRTNKYMMEFYVNDTSMKFYFDSTTNKLVSEEFTDADRIYIKAVYNGALMGNDSGLYIEAFNVFDESSKLTYLSTAVTIKLRINFNYETGVGDINVSAGRLVQNGADTGTSLIPNKYVNNNKIYLATQNGQDSATENGAYILYLSAILRGGNAVNNIGIINFNVSVIGGENNPLKIKQWEKSDGIGKNFGSSLKPINTTITYEYNSAGSVDNAIILVFNKDTDVGQYVIRFTQGNGFVKDFELEVYDDFTSADLINYNLHIENNATAFKNDPLADYNEDIPFVADYIVASGSSLNINFDISNRYTNTSIIKSYSFSVANYEGNENITEDNVEEYLKIEDGLADSALINFIRGTIVNGQINYVVLTLKVYVRQYSDILTEAETTSFEKDIVFFIFDEISYDDITLNVPNYVEVYANNDLGHYNKALSEQEIHATLSDENLWNYVQAYQQGTGDKYKVTFTSDSENPQNVQITNQQQNGGTLHFYEQDSIVLRVIIKQFNTVFSFPINVQILTPVVTDRVVVNGYNTIIEGASLFTSGLKDRNGVPTLNLKFGSTNATYQIVAENQAETGDVTHEGITLVVTDQNGHVDSNIVAVKGDKLNVVTSASTTVNLKLYIFATDALKMPIGTSISNVNELLMDSHSNAYLVVDLILSNGSAINPYLIYTADEFKDINSDPTKHYKLMNNINLSNTDFVINNFSGGLTSDYDATGEQVVYYDYSVFGIKLNENRQNLFTTNRGNISNINFVVEYGYNITSNNVLTLGIVGENEGTLENVTVSITSINNSFNGNNEAYFGGLVGVNKSEIKYTSNQIIGVSGNISLAGGKEVYFGGLVGKNEGSVVGCNAQTINLNLANTLANKVEFGVSINNAGSIANTTILAQGLTNQNSAVGGVIGYNTNAVNYLVASGHIDGANNVGGIIGKNETTAKTVNFEIDNGNLSSIIVENAKYENFLIKNSISSVTVLGTNNVGGVVGLDLGGSYYNTYCQIVAGASVSGTSNVGGIAGSSTNGVFAFCSVMSYKWNYGEEVNTFDNPDILGNTNVGGIVGGATSNLTSVVNSGSSNACAVISCSVNAYVSGKSNTAGLVVNSSNISLILDAYFMGKIDNATAIDPSNTYGVEGLIIATETDANYSIFNRVYNRLMDINSVVTYEGGEDNFSIKPTTNYPSITNWGGNANINGGYMYVELNGKPIFELMPQTLVATTKDNYILTDVENKEVSNTLHLYYYTVEDALHSNSYSILNLLSIAAKPDLLESVRVTATSSNDNIVRVSYGTLTVRGAGNCVLTIASAFNPAIKTKINIIVTLPFGDEFYVSNSSIENNITKDGDVKIVKAGSKQFYVSFKSAAGYSTIANPSLKVEVTYVGKEANFANFLSINGNALKFDGASTTIDISEASVFSVTVNSYFEGKFKFIVTPYIQLNVGDSVVKVYNTIDEVKQNFTFNLCASKGATSMHSSVNNQNLYPSDRSSLTIYITTDEEIDPVQITKQFSISGEGTSQDNSVANENISFGLQFVSSNFDAGNNRQMLTYNVTVVRLKDFTTAQEVDVTFGIEGVSTTAHYRILPERIANIIIENYLYTDNIVDGHKDIEKSPVLRQNERGLIVIDMDPLNGYYDYLEIDDLSGGNLIAFRQLDGVNGNRVQEAETISSDGFGIKLQKQQDTNRIFVETRVSINDSSRLHEVRVKAYLNDGTLLKQNYYTISVRMLPEIHLYYRNPNGTEKQNENSNFYSALGVDTYLRAETLNADANSVNFSLSFENNAEDANNYFEIEQTRDGFYTLHYKTNNIILLNRTLIITATTRATQANGQFDEASEQIKLKIVNFVIHNISVSNSRTGSTGKEIYGNFNTPTKLEFYFAPQDISYYNNGFFNQTYREDSSTRAINENIYNILHALNNNTINASEYLKFDPLNADLTFENNVLTVKSLTGSTVLNLTLPMHLTNNQWELGMGDENAENITYTDSFNLNFVNLTSSIHPDVITDEADLLSTSFAPGYYVLGNDLNLFNFAPLEVGDADGQIVFDGNGRRIIIHSFGEFNEQNVTVGLFERIPSNMIVVNLEVIYITERDNLNGYTLGYIDRQNIRLNSITYKNLFTSASVEYVNASFGGVAAVNDGTISNCTVSGYVAFEASYNDENGGKIYADFNMGGIVAENNGTITHSTSKLGMFAHANIGGLAYVNGGSGRIISSQFDASQSFATNRAIQNYKISATENYSTTSINISGMIYAFTGAAKTIDVAGFVVNNSGEVSMCFANISNTTINGRPFENIESNYEFAGFVYHNSSVISNCYSIVDTMSNSQASFSGFVANNESGTIQTSYSFVTNGVHADWRAIDMFISRLRENKGTLIDCYEINSDIVSGNEVVTKIAPTELANKEKYTNFLFGDNVSSVWTISSGTPQLVSTLDAVTYDAYEHNDELCYYGLRRVDVDPATGLFTLNNNGYGNKNNPILIYDINGWNDYLANENDAYLNKYYRLICNLDFGDQMPKSSTKTFSGNIQGNNMTIDNILLYSSDSLSSIGLFKQIVGGQDVNIINAISNVTLNVNSIKAQQTTAVGVLAGIVENFNLYNITLGSSNGDNNVINGGNAVGALAGVIRGQFDIENITSNLNIFSAYEFSQTNRYNLYLSKNNGSEVSSNLDMVFYSGGIAGIVDGYDYSNYNVNNARNINEDKYFEIRNINLNNVSVNGLNVGSAFGLVGERVKISNANITLNLGYLSGLQYAAGMVGENRGVISYCTINATANDIFANSTRVSAGIVGLNLGGLVIDSAANINIIKTDDNSIVGGIVGRNINGNIVNCTFDGNLFALYTGGIAGSVYPKSYLTSASTGTNTVYSDSIIAIPDNQITYVGNNEFKLLENNTISNNALQYWFENIENVYTLNSDSNYFNAIYHKTVVGLAVGLQGNVAIDLHYGYDENKNFVFNSSYYTEAGKVATPLFNGEVYDLPFANVAVDNSLQSSYVMYAIGAVVGNLDSWTGDDYSNEMIVFTNSNENYVKLLNDGQEVKFNIYYQQTANENEYNYSIAVFEDVDGDTTLNVNLAYFEALFNEAPSVTVNDVEAELAGQILTAQFEKNECTIKLAGNKLNAEESLEITLTFILTN